MNQRDLINALRRRRPYLTRRAATDIVNDILDLIKDALLSGGYVRLKIGTWTTDLQPARKGKIPQGPGSRIVATEVIGARPRVTFRLAPKFKQELRHANPAVFRRR